MVRGRCRGLLAAAAAFALVAACVLCACSAAGSESDATSAADQDLPRIKIGSDVLEPFFYMARDGEYAGIDADIAREACRRAGLQPEFVTVSWGERDERLADGTVDCLWSGFAINGREDRYAWTDSYLDTSLGIIVENDSSATSLEDFNGPGGIAVRANSICEQFFVNGASLPGARTFAIHSYGTADMAETAFVKAFADGWASCTVVLDQFLAENPGRFRYLSNDLMTLHLGVAFQKGYDGPYLAALNAALDDMRRDGTIAAIEQRYAAGTDAAEGAGREN